jgi:N-acetylneuraminic acid mutarotase
MRYLANRPLQVAVAGLVLVAAAALGVRLYQGNVGVEPSSSSNETPAPRPSAVPAVWTTAEEMHHARYLQSATLLKNGTILIAGGRDNAAVGPALASSEIYDPIVATWTDAPSMLSPRSSHSATLLADGRVLVAGGFNDWAALPSAELYDPATGSWSTTGSMEEARGYHTATLLPDGRVLVTGGRSNNSSTGHALNSAEIYDPTTGRWTSVESMSRARFSHTATLLATGQVLVAGAGIGTGARVDLAVTAELYDPDSGGWTPTGNMTVGRVYHTATLLPNGQVLVAGGRDSVAGEFQAGGGDALATAELYDPATGSWASTGSLMGPRAFDTAVQLSDGEVLVVGGIGVDPGFGAGTSTYSTGTGTVTAEMYAVGSGSWTETASLAVGRQLHIAVLFADGSVLVAGGSTAGRALSSTEVYGPGASR